jgi:hypothetical protein
MLKFFLEFLIGPKSKTAKILTVIGTIATIIASLAQFENETHWFSSSLTSVQYSRDDLRKHFNRLGSVVLLPEDIDAVLFFSIDFDLNAKHLFAWKSDAAPYDLKIEEYRRDALITPLFSEDNPAINSELATVIDHTTVFMTRDVLFDFLRIPKSRQDLMAPNIKFGAIRIVNNVKGVPAGCIVLFIRNDTPENRQIATTLLSSIARDIQERNLIMRVDDYSLDFNSLNRPNE